MTSWRLLAALLLVAGNSYAHEHHGDAIPEGEAVSADPIVRVSLSSLSFR